MGTLFEIENTLRMDFARPLESVPFFLRRKGVHLGGERWSFGCATSEYDEAQESPAAILAAFQSDGHPEAGWPIRGCELASGAAIWIGDLRGDGEDALYAVDAEGQVRAFGADGRPLPDFGAEPSDMMGVMEPPVVADVNGDGRPELAFVSLSLEGVDGMSMADIGGPSKLQVCDARGKPLKGFPLLLEPPAVSGLLVASLGGGNNALVLLREDGCVCVCDPRQPGVRPAGSVPAEATPLVRLAAVDLDADGRDELVFSAGGDELTYFRLGQGADMREILLTRPGATFTAVAPGRTADGTPVLCAFDESRKQLVIAESGRSWRSEPVGEGQVMRLACLTPLGDVDRVGTIFATVLFEDAAERDVEKVFEAVATEEMKTSCARYREALGDSAEASVASYQAKPELKSKVRRFKADLLVAHLGDERADRMLWSPQATEFCLFDAAGRLCLETPIRVVDHSPFHAPSMSEPMPPAMFIPRSGGRVFLLLGLNSADENTGTLFLHELHLTSRAG